MLAFRKDNFKTILLALKLFVLGVVVAFFTENYYRQLVRFLFKFFNGDKIDFIGKDFHLFASIKFIVTFGLFCSLITLVLNKNKFYNEIKAISYLSTIFFLATTFISLLDSKRLIIECVTCDNGIRKLTYNEITYDFYFILSLLTSLVITSWFIFRHSKNFDNLIGLWTREDDGNGLLSIFGWSLKFNLDKTGEYKYWENDLTENLDFDFLWERISQNSISIRAKINDNWTTLDYEIVEVNGAYNSRQFKLTEKGKNKFWNSPEPIYRQK